MNNKAGLLEFRAIPIPRSPLIEWLEAQTQQSFTCEHRHFLLGVPIHCGEFLEVFVDGEWAGGRYEWTGDQSDPPTLTLESRTLLLDAGTILRWPEPI